MWLLIIIVIVAVLYIVSKRNSTAKTETVSNNSVPAEVPGIMSFLHGFHSLCNSHKIVSSDVLISWKTVDSGSEIRAYTKIFRIDGQYASDSVDILRMSISQAKCNIETSNKGTNPVDLYRLKQKAAEKVILDFFGTNLLEGSFWDIDDCEYVDGKYLEFEAMGMVYDLFNQSRDKTLDSICSKTAEKYSNACISRQANNTITISFN